MCGINGIYAYHSAAGRTNEAELLRTRDHMIRRGPDGSGRWCSDDGRCALGHRRLSILDLTDTAAQPMVSADERFVITFNGEIYNFRALRRELEEHGCRFHSSSDTEVLLYLYARHGAEMVHRLCGMYAFAIWDKQRRELFLARDPYGVKPLYTANDGWSFRFASQVKALLEGGAISRDPEPAGIVGFHLFGSVPEPFTLYRDIRALPAGHTQIVDCGGPREPERFANLAAILSAGTREDVADGQLTERVRVGVRESVKRHLVSDVEVGLFLSAGIDSGALLGLMRDVDHGNRIRAITLGFEEFEGTCEDELPLAARTAAYYAAEHVERRVTRREFEHDLPDILSAMDQPSIDGINTWFVSKAASENGLKVVLSGIGGDELLAGYPSFTDVPRWRRRYGWLAAVPGLGFASRKAVSYLAPSFATRKPKALGFLEYAHCWAGAYLLRRGLFLPRELSSVLDADLARDGLRRLRPLASLSSSLRPDPGSDIGRVCVLEASHYMRNQLLRDADWAGMAHGLEVRVPFVDVGLLKSVAPLIPSLNSASGKAALARSPSVPLPEEVITRAKTGFRVPTEQWMNAAASSSSSLSQCPLGLLSRNWSRFVFDAPANETAVRVA